MHDSRRALSLVIAGTFAACGPTNAHDVKPSVEPVPDIATAPVDAAIPAPVVPYDPDAIVELGLGSYMGCLRRGDGTVACWGDRIDDLGEIAGISAATALSVGTSQACALSSDGTARCWGDWHGTVELTGAGEIVQLAVGGGPCALTRAGDVFCWSGVGTGAASSVQVPDLAGVDKIVAGDMHACALNNVGEVWCWGSNSQGQLGVVGGGGGTPHRVTAIKGAIDVAAGGRQSCALLAGGKAYCWGGLDTSTAAPDPYEVVGVPPVANLAVGRRFVCARTNDAQVWCWGSNADGVLGDGTRTDSDAPVRARIDHVDQLAAGSGFACAVRAGQMSCWGDNDRGQLLRPGGRSSPIDVAGVTDVADLVASANTTCAIHADRTVSCWGRELHPLDHLWTPAKVPNLAGVEELHMSSIHACALLDGGAVSCFGYNGEGELGNGTTQAANGAVSVSKLTGVTQLVVGPSFTCAVIAGGEVACWGSVFGGLLGVRSKSDDVAATTPRKVAKLTGVRELVAGSHDLCAIVKGGKVMCWGSHRAHGTVCAVGPSDGITCEKPPPPAPEKLAGIPKIEHVVIGDAHIGRLYASNGAEYALWLDPKPVPGSEIGTLGGDTPGKYEVGARAELLAKQYWRGYEPDDAFCRLTDDATVACQTDNQHGEAAQGHFDPVTQPTVVPGLAAVERVVAGQHHACALVAGGTVRCWGNNAYGQLGPDESSNLGLPAQILLPARL